LQLGIIKCDCDSKGGKLVFNQTPSINPERLIDLVQSQARLYRFDGPTALRFTKALPNPADRLQFIRALLNLLQK
jgi:transcription-repair coupling factor (superfamily II helicase)